MALSRVSASLAFSSHHHTTLTNFRGRGRVFAAALTPTSLAPSYLTRLFSLQAGLLKGAGSPRGSTRPKPSCLANDAGLIADAALKILPSQQERTDLTELRNTSWFYITQALFSLPFLPRTSRTRLLLVASLTDTRTQLDDKF
ncbi:hypothetical protein HMN09_00683300 [Mycena chlorophos]|uniref:Uncharacterized protein n=1 Tax=Mycena chlorophos TaxID=658473 RepID=A0A8H6WDF7_MYCCL|nr:hypothetical protein HMN09_00683300 [Mycena chlorophos]